MSAPRSLVALGLVLIFVSGCSTASGRFAIGAGIGAPIGATGAALLSPNPESRGLNALVFGLTGALIGGVVGLLTTPSGIPHPEGSLREKQRERDAKEYLITPSSQKLPSFVKERLKPVVIEEYLERDSVDEDGSLHEPHKVYRIKRPAELVAEPGALELELNPKKGNRP